MNYILTVEKITSMLFNFDPTCFAFFGRGEDGFFQCEDCCFASGL